MQSKPVLIFFGILILFFAWSVLGFWNKMQETEKNKKIVEDKVAALKQQKETYLSEINDLKTDQGKEKFIRENYGWAKEGEGVTVVIEDKNPPVAPKNNFSSDFWSFLTSWFK